MNDYIVTHETFQPRVTLRAFTTQHLLVNGWAVPPSFDSTKGRVEAAIRQGKWVTVCPNTACNGAMVASSVDRYFICSDCANEANQGYWFKVVWPRDWAAIEAVLLRRPAITPMRADTRNWERPETVADLERENAEHGLEAVV